MSEYEYEDCPDCGQKQLLDSGPLGMNCFSDVCTARGKEISRRWAQTWRRAEIERLEALERADAS